METHDYNYLYLTATRLKYPINLLDIAFFTLKKGILVRLDESGKVTLFLPFSNILPIGRKPKTIFKANSKMYKIVSPELNDLIKKSKQVLSELTNCSVIISPDRDGPVIL